MNDEYDKLILLRKEIKYILSHKNEKRFKFSDEITPEDIIKLGQCLLYSIDLQLYNIDNDYNRISGIEKWEN